MAWGDFAKSIREAMSAATEAADGGPILIADVARRLDMITDKEKQKLYRTVRDFVKSGEVMRVEGEKGVIRYIGKNSRENEIRKKMWRVLRARRSVTVEDLQELAGASREYAKEWLRMLVRREMARPAGSKFVLISNVVEMPEDEDKKEKLRNIRAAKKQHIMARLDRVADIMGEIKRQVEGL